MERHIRKVPSGLTHGARSFVRTHGVRLEPIALDDSRDRWLAAGIPVQQIDRVVAFEQKWGLKYRAMIRLWRHAWNEFVRSLTTTSKSAGSTAHG
ncbi:hypothetical protein Atai01_32500 [Amycolatopsis taiwanensis]|uniref:Uncharacterized protein n=1 Tax=Amycolatopsis taiwanensis TaxID=342230 RepID=A0A9W6R0Y7_9PSEU|nr:hypothetical protein Atai01_32500 [Amycolatopsis taiwanensis]